MEKLLTCFAGRVWGAPDPQPTIYLVNREGGEVEGEHEDHTTTQTVRTQEYRANSPGGES